MTTTLWEEEYKRRTDDLKAASDKLTSPSLSPSSVLRVLRVHQLDAFIFDSEVESILQHQLFHAFDWLPQGTLQRFKPELSLLVSLLLFYFSLFLRGASVGQSLQNLVFRDERSHARLLTANRTRSESSLPASSTSQRFLFGVLSLIFPYALSKIQGVAAEQGWADLPPSAMRRRTWALLKRGEGAWRALSLVNLLAFLVDGKYPNLLARVLGMRLVYAARSQPRMLNFEYLNQQLVWHGFTEFLMFLVPLLSSSRVFSALKRIMTATHQGNQPHSDANVVPAAASTPPIHDSSQESSSPLFSPRDFMGPCAFCQATPIVVPFAANCRHLFCYHCVRAASLDSPLDCPVCQSQITSLQRPYAMK